MAIGDFEYVFTDEMTSLKMAHKTLHNIAAH